MFSKSGCTFFALLCLTSCSALAISPTRQHNPKQVLQNKNTPTIVTTTRNHERASRSNILSYRGGHSTVKILQSSIADTNEVDPSPTASEISRGGAAPLHEQPTLAQILRFALPCLALWIAQPLLSLVDTITVGLSAAPGAGATQLGALGPATTFIDGATYLFAFLNTATTNLYASALARAQKSNPSKRNDPEYLKQAGNSVARTAAKISLISGFALSTLLFTVGKTLLRIYIGADVADTSIVQPASEYMYIRALSMPTSLLYGVIQAALLGAKDSVTPLIAIAYSTVVNTVGDVALVCFVRMGIVGAAIATVAAQWAGTAAMIGPARRRLFAEVPTSREDENHVSSRAFLAFAAPVLTLILGKIAAFGVMTHVAAALPGKESLAAHQIILSLFFFISPFLEVISQTAQAFLPPFFTPSDSSKKSKKQKEEEDAVAEKEAGILALRLLRLGVIVGAVMGSVAALVPRFIPQMLTNDFGVQQAVRPLATPLLMGALLTAPVAVSEGILLAKRELGYLAAVYLVSTALLPPALIYYVKLVKGPVVNVWWGFAAFQLFRALCFTGRLWGGKVIGALLGGKNAGVAAAVEAKKS